jgi:hypothetical protein
MPFFKSRRVEVSEAYLAYLCGAFFFDALKRSFKKKRFTQKKTRHTGLPE